jgi:Secretion system C-terminal sorting domain
VYTVGVFRSTDNGTTWIKKSVGISNPNVWCFSSIGTTIFAGSADGLFRTTDNGETWTIIGTDIPYPGINSIVAVGTALVVGTEGSGVYFSHDLGNTWEEGNTGMEMAPGHPIMNVQSLAASETHLYAGAYNGVFKRPLSDFGISDVDDNDGLADEITITPNPTNGMFTISGGHFDANNIAIVDVLGQRIVVSALAEGENITFDLTKQARGTYYVRVVSQGSVLSTILVVE